MKLTKLLLCILTFPIIFLVSCEKEHLENQSNKIERKQAHNAIDAITKQFSTTSLPYKTEFAEVVKLLDFNDVSVVLRPSLSALILIRIIKNDADSRKRYLAVSLPNSKSDNIYRFQGIYSTNDLSYIKQAITTNRIEKGNIVTLRLLNEKLLKEWDATGINPVARISVPKSILTPSQFSMINGGNQSIKANSIQEPEPDCVNYYLVSYNSETGDIYSITFLYQDCTDYGGAGGGGGDGYYNNDSYTSKTFFDARPAGTSDDAPKVEGFAYFQASAGIFVDVLTHSTIPTNPSDTYWKYKQISKTNTYNNSSIPMPTANVGFIGELSNTANQSFPVSATTSYTYRDVFGK